MFISALFPRFKDSSPSDPHPSKNSCGTFLPLQTRYLILCTYPLCCGLSLCLPSLVPSITMPPQVLCQPDLAESHFSVSREDCARDSL